MRGRYLFIVYVVIGISGSIAVQALPMIYNDYGFSSLQIYNLLSIVFLATALQPIIGYVIDKKLTQDQGLSALFSLAAITSLILFFLQSYTLVLIFVFLLSMFRIPTITISDGYNSTIAHMYGTNMPLIRSGASIGYGIGIILLESILVITHLSTNYAFIFIAIISLTASLLISVPKKIYRIKNVQQQVKEDHVTKKTDWSIIIPLVITQVLFFGCTILKISYTTPFLMFNGFNNTEISMSLVMGALPIFILMPLFSKIFRRYKRSTIMLVTICVGLIQTILYLSFPSSLFIVYLCSFLNGFLFPLYSPVYSMILRSSLDPKYISTGFTAIISLQNMFVFLFNALIVMNLVNIIGSPSVAFYISLLTSLIALIPVSILIYKKQ
ncbi:MAG: MFS transporter [Mycoplasmatales bacterium]